VHRVVEGLLGYPEARNFSFANIRLVGGTLADISQVSSEKPLNGLTLENITGTCAKGITMQHVNQAFLQHMNVTGFAGALLATNAFTGIGLEGAAPYTPPPRR
jgi:hypothetical protein